MSEIHRLVDEANAVLKSDAKAAIRKLEAAWTLAEPTPETAAGVAEELARAWARRKIWSRAIHWARRATKLNDHRKSAWATLGKTCELVALRTDAPTRRRRTKALHRATASAFKKAAELATDREDKSWLLELARDAAKSAS